MRRHSTTTTEPYSQQWRMVRRSVCVCSGGEVAILSMTQSPREDQYWHDNQILSPPPSSSLEGIHSAMQVTSLPYLFKLLFHCKDDALTKKFNNQRRNEQLSIWRATPHDVIFFSFFGSIFLFPFSFLFQYSLDNKTDKNYYFLPSGAYNIQTPFIISRHHGSVWPEKGRPNWISVCARGHKDSICHHYFLNILPMEWRAYSFPPTPEKAIFWTDPKMLKATLMARSNGQHEYLGVIKRTIKMVGKRDCK